MSHQPCGSTRKSPTHRVDRCTRDRAAIVLSRATPIRPADDQPWVLGPAHLPAADRLAELGFPDPPEGDDHHADSCPYCAGI